MAKDPSIFAWDFLKMAIDTELHGRQWVSVGKYLTSSRYKKDEQRKRVYGAVNQFVRRAKDEDDNRRYRNGYFHAPTLRPTGAVEISISKIYMCFLGKGTPADFRATIQVCDYFLNHSSRVTRLWATRPTIQDFVDRFVSS